MKTNLLSTKIFEDADALLPHIKQHLPPHEYAILIERLGGKLHEPKCPHVRGSDEGTQWCALGASPTQELQAEAAAVRAIAMDLITGLTETMADLDRRALDLQNKAAKTGIEEPQLIDPDARGRLTVLIDDAHRLLTAEEIGQKFLQEHEALLTKLQEVKLGLFAIHCAPSHRKASKVALKLAERLKGLK